VALFHFSIGLDQDECLERASSSDNDEQAVQEGCDVLMGLVFLLRPAIARSVEYRGGGDTGAPVGTWTYREPSPVPHWTACHN
jgi:hypothetical protein